VSVTHMNFAQDPLSSPCSFESSNTTTPPFPSLELFVIQMSEMTTHHALNTWALLGIYPLGLWAY
jgi:hypothetical protein